MKQKLFLPLFFLFLAFISGCQEKKSSSSSGQNCVGNNYFTVPGCPGYVGSNPITNPTNCSGNAYWTTPGCTGFCQFNQTHASCGGSATAGSSGGSIGGSGGGLGGVNCAQYPYSYDCYCKTNPLAYGCPTQAPQVSKNWGVKYPVMPAGSCSATTTTANKYPTRKGTTTINFGTWYNPADPVAPNYVNTTSTLKSIPDAKMFLLTDSLLKIRFKVNPEPDAAMTTPENSCWGRGTTNSSLAGYTKLQFYAKIIGTKSDGTTQEEPLPGNPFTVQVNSCSPAVDLSSFASYYTGGMYLVIYNVRSNKGIWPSDYDTKGFLNSNSFTGASSQRSVECWTMDIEVAADGTQTFN